MELGEIQGFGGESGSFGLTTDHRHWLPSSRQNLRFEFDYTVPVDPVDLPFLEYNPEDLVSPISIYEGIYGEAILKTDPSFYYPSDHNDFSFNCQYTLPSGNVNLHFPDQPCRGFEEFVAYSGESLFVVLSEFTFLGFVDLSEGSTLSVLIGSNEFFLPIAYEGSEFAFGLQTSVQASVEFTDGSVVESFNLVINPPDIIDATALGGETAVSSLYAYTLFSLDGRDGSEATAGLDIHPALPVSALGYEGSSVDLSLTTSAYLSAIGYDGSEISAVLLTSVILTTDSYEGSNAVSDLDIHPALPISALGYEGSDSVATLAQSVLFSASGYDGSELLSTNLLSSVILSADSYEGSNAVSDLDTHSSFSLTLDSVYEGSSVDLSLTTSSYLSAIGYEGSDLSTIVLTTVILSTDDYEGSTVVASLDTHSSFSLTVDSFIEGSRLDDLSLISAVVLVGTAYDGSTIVTDLTTQPLIAISADSYEGSTVVATLAGAVVLSADAREGSETAFDLSTRPQIFLSIPVYEGSRLDVSFELFQRFEIQNQDGTTLSFVLDTHPAFGLTLDPISEGTILDIDLIRYVSLAVGAESGECLDFEIEYLVNLGMDLSIEIGETLEVDELHTTPSLNPVSESGESVSLDLSVSTVLGTIQSYEGSFSVSTLTPRAPITLSALGYSGEQSTLNSIAMSSIKLNARGYSGEYTEISLKDTPSSGIGIFDAYEGFRSEVSVQISQSLGLIGSVEGVSLLSPTLSEEPNWYYVSGERLEIDLWTISLIESECRNGERLSLTLDTHESFPMTLRAYSGEMIGTDNIGHSASGITFEILFRYNAWASADIDSTVSFDTRSGTCCSDQPATRVANEITLEMDYAEYPHEIMSGTFTRFQASLATRQRFEIVAYSGEFAYAQSTIKYTRFDSMILPASGEFASIAFESDLTARLCYGYFLPNGSNLVIELTDVLSENCNILFYEGVVYDGSTMKVPLSVNAHLEPEIAESGESLYVNLVEDKPWSFDFRGGEHAECQGEPLFRLDSGEGSTMLPFGFYEPPILGYSGEHSTAEIDISKAVVHIEIGELLNEYQYQNEDGDIIREKFTEVAIEGQPFSHSIRAICSFGGVNE